MLAMADKDWYRARNQIAHGVTGVNIRKVDVTRYRNYVQGFAERFDGAVRRHVRGLTGSDPWLSIQARAGNSTPRSGPTKRCSSL